MFAGLREEGLKQMTGEERKRFEKRTRWAVTSPGPNVGVFKKQK